MSTPNRLIRLFSLLVFQLIYTVAVAQDFKKDCELMGDFYAQSNNYSTQLGIEAYMGSNRIYDQKAVIKKAGEEFYYSIDETEMMLNKTDLIIVRRKEKTILYQSLASTNPLPFMKQTPLYAIDSMFKNYDSVIYQGVASGMKSYTVLMKKGQVRKADLYLDETNHEIRKVIYYYDPKVAGEGYKSVVSFNALTSSDNESSLYKTSSYVINKEGHLQPSSNYLQYKITVVSNEK